MKDDFCLTRYVVLGGGFIRCCLFSSLPGKWPNLTHIFQMGWNHQLVYFLFIYIRFYFFESTQTCKICTCGTECYSNKNSLPNLTQGVLFPVENFLGFFAAKGTEITGEPTFVLGDRVRIVATKQQSKARGLAVVFGGLECLFGRKWSDQGWTDQWVINNPNIHQQTPFISRWNNQLLLTIDPITSNERDIRSRMTRKQLQCFFHISNLRFEVNHGTVSVIYM